MYKTLHPMAYKQMGGWLDDLWGNVTDSAKAQASQIISQAPAQIANAAASTILQDSKVQQVAQQQAAQAATEKLAQEYQAALQNMQAQYAAFKADPMAWVKNNPGKVAIMVGGVAAIGLTIYFVARGATAPRVVRAA